MTFLATWGYASDFLEMLPKFQMAARGRLQIVLSAQKLQNLKVGNYSNFTVTFPTIWSCASDFFKVLLKFKIAAMDKLHIFLSAQKLKIEVSNNSHCTVQSHYPPFGNVQVILLKFKMATKNRLFKYL